MCVSIHMHVGLGCARDGTMAMLLYSQTLIGSNGFVGFKHQISLRRFIFYSNEDSNSECLLCSYNSFVRTADTL